jgi:hypothetical protein
MDTCNIPNCTRKRNGNGLRCSRHSKPSQNIMDKVLSLLEKKPRARLSEIAAFVPCGKSTAKRALWALEDER